MNSLFRNLIVLQGDEHTIALHLDFMSKSILGDWVTISSSTSFIHQVEYCLAPSQTKNLLGREFKHAIFDARVEFNLDAFAILSGTLMANSILILLLPNDFSHWIDNDSLRWNEQPEPILVPHFITHLTRTIQQQKIYYPNNTFELVIKKSNKHDELSNFIIKHIPVISEEALLHLILPPNDERVRSNDCCILNGNEYKPTKNNNKLLTYNKHDEQLNLLTQLLLIEDDIVLLTAKRGRGKSALAGMFSNYHNCWVIAPNKKSITTLAKFAEKQITFFAPDELINQLQISKERPDWLIIDEAAMIPLPMMMTLLNQSYKVLLTSTVDGYEGTGQGLLLKLCQQYQSIKKIGYYQLTTPIRWVDNDPLEYLTDNLIVAHEYSDVINLQNSHVKVSKVTQQKLVESSNELSAFFGLLKCAHYRTTLIDLRRLLDAQNINLYQAQFNEKTAGVLVTVNEGGLSDELIELVWKGVRRPKGNLVAQSLVAHAGVKEAAKLLSVRINRIAVSDSARKQGIARKLIQNLIQEKQSEYCDFISVSFAYNLDMYQFWSKLGFTIIHIGTHQEASSGSYAAMAILPISEAGHNLTQKMHNKLSRNWYWLRNWINIDLPITIDDNQDLTLQDRLELLHFATTSYSYTASLSVLSRLANWIKLNPSCIKDKQRSLLLLDMIANRLPEDVVVKKQELTGKKQLLKQLRQDIYHLVVTLPV